MKKQLIHAGAALLGVTAMADTLTPEQALARALDGGPAASRSITNAQPTLVHTQYTDQNMPAAYVFARQQAGYLVLAADDVAVPVLGYSDDGVFDPQNENLQYWLGEYAREIAAAQAAGAQPVSGAQYAPSNWSKISPLCKTTWDQGAPYNLLCPMQGGARSVTGCVATAMAQVMKYHNWPPKGDGSVSYQTDTYHLQVSCNFADYTYDWSAMLNNYSGTSTEAQRTAVAQLMFSCGSSVKMDYSSESSGAQSADAAVALVRYFDYDKSLKFMGRDFYSLTDWQTAIYDNLKNVGPVFYAGTSAGGGHAFVCDGYDTNGYFHFNWGWSGASDGYYLLTALNPEAQGIGGSSSTDGFNSSQRIILGAKKNSGGDYSYSMIWSDNFQVKTANANVGSNIKVTGAYSYCVPSVNGSLGVFITNSSGNKQYVAGTDFTALGIQRGYTEVTVKLPSSLAAGTYTITPAFQIVGSDPQPVLVSINKVQSYTMTVSGNTCTFAANSADATVAISNVESIYPHFYAGKRLSFTATANNTGSTEFYNNVQGALFKTTATSGSTPEYTGDTMLLDVEPGKSETFEYVSPFTAAKGNYIFAFINPSTKQWLSDGINVSLEALPSNTQITASDLVVANTFEYDGKPTLNDVSNIMFKFDVECTTGFFDEPLTICCIRGENAASDGTWASFFNTPVITLYEDQSKEVTAFGYISRPRDNNYYTCYLVKGTANYNHTVYAGPYTFYYSSNAEAGIAGVEADAQVVNEVLYNLQGIQVPADQAHHGHYIKVTTYDNGKTATSHIVK